MSIFTKDCPQCAETNAAYAIRCRCGFAFNADADDAETQTEEEIALEEEKLYQEYLAARAKQANSSANDASRLAADQPTDQPKVKDADQAKAVAEHVQAELNVQNTRVDENPTESKPASVAPPAAPPMAQAPKAELAPPAPKPPAATLPVEATVPEGTTESKPAKVAPPAAPAVADVRSALPAPKPPAQTTVSAGTPKTQAPKPAGGADQSWLIPKAESDAQPQTPPRPPAAKPVPATSVKPTTARPALTAAKVDTAKMSAAERAKKLEQRLKAVQAKRGDATPAMGANTSNRIHTPSAATKTPSPESTSVPVATTPQPTAAPTAAIRAPVKGPAPAMPATTPAAKTEAASAPSPTKPTSAAIDTKPDQPETIDEATSPELKKVNGNDTVPSASDTVPSASDTTVEARAVKEAAQSPAINATAKADLEAALQALHTKAPVTPAPTENSNGADQAAATPEELPDTNTEAPLGDLTEKSGLGCTEKECPNCTALVPMDADRCGCGFSFPTDDDAMPSLSLSDSDVEALEKRKKSSGISHLG